MTPLSRLRENPKQFRLFATLVLLLAGGVSLLPLLLTGNWYDSHEYYRYPWLVQLFADAMSAGIFYPRWLPQINGAYGYPTFVYYQPGFFYLAGVFQLVLNEAVSASYCALYVTLLVAATGAYRLSRWMAGRPESLVIALIYLSTPYVITNYVTRGDLTELLAMAFCPWQILYVIKISQRFADQRRYFRHVLILGLLMAAQTYSHPFVAAPMLGVLMGLSLVKIWESGWNKELAKAYIAALAGGVMAALPYWWNLVTMKNEVEYAAAISDYFITTNHLHGIAYLAEHFWSVPLLLSLPGFYLARHKPFSMALLGMMAMLVLCTHNVARPLWEHVHVLDYFQFPWRFYAIVAALQIYGLAWLVYYKPVIGARNFEILLCLALVVNVGIEAHRYTFPIANHFENVRNYLPWQFETLNNRREFDPRTMINIHALQDRRRYPVPVVEAIGEMSSRTRLSLDPSFLPYRIKLDASIAAPRRHAPDVTHVMINQLYFPGWKVRVNGSTIHLAGADSRSYDPVIQIEQHGRMVVKLPGEGRYHVEVWYDGPPGWALRNFLAVLSITALAVWLRWPYVPRKIYSFVKEGLTYAP